MQSKILFPIQVMFLFVLSFAAFWWFMNDGPVPGVQLQPLTPSSELTSFEQAIEEATRLAEDRELGIVSMEEPHLEGRIPAFMRPQLLAYSASTIMGANQSQSAYSRRSRGNFQLMEDIARFGLILRTYPDVEMPISGGNDSTVNRVPGSELSALHGVTVADVKEAIQSLWLKDIIVLNDFPDESRTWLETFIRQ